MTQLHFPGLEPPTGPCLVQHPLFDSRKCIYAIGHEGLHGAIVPGTSMISQWGEDIPPCPVLLIKDDSKIIVAQTHNLRPEKYGYAS